ncbi:mechanosensitive ion channel protein MscS [Pontibacter vulgaris]|uniref:mechanosensitive ion channel protein MscS n=1 Tax=Pontibacter vulgaris TaxID=2905679 RepID=UPI001FA78F30|nr:mechanosensitive ion channel protein MscS [Pontibacter vulgaris]
MFKNIIYAILLGIAMAACLDNRENVSEEKATTASETSPVIPSEEIPEIDPATFLIAKDQAGSIKIGMPVEQMRQNVPAAFTITDTILNKEGQQYTAYVLKTAGEKRSLLVEQICEPACKVWRITVLSPDFKTASGIVIGSKYDEVRQKYKINYVSPGEGIFVAVDEAAGFSFVLDKPNLPAGNPANLKPDDIPANTLVKSILIY